MGERREVAPGVWIEAEARAMGLEYSTWGSGRPDVPVAAGPMCSSCELRFELEAA